MYARIHTLETTTEQDQQGARVIREELLPWVRESAGFRGLLGLSDHAGTSLVITLWADEAALQAGSEAARKLSDLTAAGIGATLRSLDEYEVTVVDLG